MKNSYILLIIIIIVILYYCAIKTHKEYFEMTRIKPDNDNREYMVVSKYQDAKKAAEIIAELNKFAIDVIKKLREVYLQNPQSTLQNPQSTIEYSKGQKITRVLEKRFNPDSMRENEPDSPNNTSFTTNKGEVISMCLREKQSGENKFHDIDILKFVFIHELAHIITKEMDHVVNFWINFRFLLEFCEKYGLYKSKSYHKENVNYCGMNVTYNPTADDNLYSYFNKNPFLS